MYCNLQVKIETFYNPLLPLDSPLALEPLTKLSKLLHVTPVQVIFVVDTVVSYYCIYYEYYLNRRYVINQWSFFLN